MKILKCPKCGEILSSVERYAHCVEYGDVSITEDGKDVETNTYNDSYDKSWYRCPECLHEDSDIKVYIVDTEPCTHVPDTPSGKYLEYGQETSQRYTQCTECHCILDPDC